jgi:hypothetical protein
MVWHQIKKTCDVQQDAEIQHYNTSFSRLCLETMPSFLTPNRHGYSVRFSPFQPERIACATSQYFGLAGKYWILIILSWLYVIWIGELCSCIILLTCWLTVIFWYLFVPGHLNSLCISCPRPNDETCHFYIIVNHHRCWWVVLHYPQAIVNTLS